MNPSAARCTKCSRGWTEPQINLYLFNNKSSRKLILITPPHSWTLDSDLKAAFNVVPTTSFLFMFVLISVVTTYTATCMADILSEQIKKMCNCWCGDVFCKKHY